MSVMSYDGRTFSGQDSFSRALTVIKQNVTLFGSFDWLLLDTENYLFNDSLWACLLFQWILNDAEEKVNLKIIYETNFQKSWRTCQFLVASWYKFLKKFLISSLSNVLNDQKDSDMRPSNNEKPSFILYDAITHSLRFHFDNKLREMKEKEK